MKKSTMKLIISLTILGIAATVTAITVPLVMQAKESDRINSIKNKTIKRANIKEGEIISDILSSSKEETMIEKIEEIRKNNSWDDIFTFTNENDKLITEVVDKVDFSLDLKSSVPQAIFKITYIEEIKTSDESNVVRANLESFVGRVSDFQIKINDISNNLINILKNESTLEAQKNVYQEWGTNPPSEIIDVVDQLFEFKEDSWDDAVDNVVINIGEYQIGQPIPPLKVKIILNSEYISYSVIEEILQFDIPVNPNIALNITKSINYDDILDNATNTLKDLLASKDFYEQKVLYDSWNNSSAPIEFKEAIKEILSFESGSIIVNWDDAVSDVTLKTGTFPNEPLQPIPNIEIKVHFNIGAYSISSGGDLLKFNSNDLGNSSLINLIVTRDDGKINEAKKLLSDRLIGKTYTSQKNEYESWEIGNLPGNFEDLIKEAFTFDGGLDWDSVGANIVLIKPPFNSPGQPVSNITIKINLSEKYNSELESLNVLLNNLGNSELVLVPNTRLNQTIIQAGRDELIAILSGANDLASQQILYNTLNINRNIRIFKEAIRDVIEIKDQDDIVDWDDAVRDIEVVPSENLLYSGSPIPAVGIKLHLFDGYFYLTDDGNNIPYFSFSIDNLGNAI